MVSFLHGFRGLSLLPGADGKAACFDGKHMTKEAVPCMVAGKQTERQEEQGHGVLIKHMVPVIPVWQRSL